MTFVGVGGAFTTADYYHSNVLLESNGKKMLIDCGSDARFSLARHGINNYNVGAEIDAVYISHIHMDHMGGLEWLGFCSYFNPLKRRPKLFISRTLVDPLWESLRAGMSAHQDGDLTLDSFFDVRPTTETFIWEAGTFNLVKTEHIKRGNGEWVPSYALDFRAEKKRVFFSADTRFFPALKDRYCSADTIFQDCETLGHKSGVHAHYDELKTMPNELKSKMWLYHYYPNPKQDAVADGFAGFVQRDQWFEV